MAEARPTVNVYSPDDKGVIIGSVALPEVFSAPIRPDVVSCVHTNMAKNGRQPYAVNKKAATRPRRSRGTGRAVSRIPRVAGGGTQRSGQGAFGNMCRSGRMFGPTKQWRMWNHKINVNSAAVRGRVGAAASAVTPLVMARGHKVEAVPEFPRAVIGGGFESISKTAKAVELLTKVGADADVDKVKASIKLRAGKGKMRNRRTRGV